MPKVFITNRGFHDYTPAKQYGDLVFITQGEISTRRIGKMYRMIAAKLEDSTSDDYIMITGLPIMQSILCAMFARKHGQINLLVYRDGRYEKKTLMIDNLNHEEEGEDDNVDG